MGLKVRSGLKKFLVYHLPAIGYAALIIALSSIPELNRSQLKILRFDKVVHFFEYAVFAFLIYRSFSNLTQRLRDKYVILLSILVVVLFSMFDEIYQSYVPGRQSDPVDMIFDILGASCIIILLSFRKKRSRTG